MWGVWVMSDIAEKAEHIIISSNNGGGVAISLWVGDYKACVKKRLDRWETVALIREILLILQEQEV
jgi:hypothetical protein